MTLRDESTAASLTNVALYLLVQAVENYEKSETTLREKSFFHTKDYVVGDRAIQKLGEYYEKDDILENLWYSVKMVQEEEEVLRALDQAHLDGTSCLEACMMKKTQ